VTLYLATAVCDRPGYLLGKLTELWPSVLQRFAGVGALVTTDTHSDVQRLIAAAGASVVMAESDADAIGRHRRLALQTALENGGGDHFLYIDPDHLLRWLEHAPDEFDRVIAGIAEADCTVIGRAASSFAALPERLARTESIVNHIYGLITGDRWDLMMAARGLSHRAARLIVGRSRVDTIGNDVEWPLLCRSRQLALRYVDAEGLTYRTNRDYAMDRGDSLDDDPLAWVLRVRVANQHIDAMRPYIDSRSST
jgi:hypothetical protein